MRRLFNIAIIAALITTISCADGGRKNVALADGVQVVHLMDTTVVPKSPKRVIVFDIGTMDTFDKLGLDIVGAPVDNIPSYITRYANDKSIEDVGSVKEANYEKIHMLKPDLIIISGRLQSSYDELSKIAPTIYMGVDYSNYMKSFEENTRTIGEIFGKEEEVETELKRINTKLEEQKEIIKEKSGKGLIVLFNNSRFSSYGKGSRFGFVHDVMGVTPSIEDIEVATHGQVISNEFIEETNPDYLFIVDRGAVVNGKGASKEEVENELIRQTNAFKNNKIIYLNPEIWYLSGGGLISVDRMIDEVAEGVS